nr:MAG TPA: Replication initiator A family protein [Caudoviricetes sp.]
MRPWRKLERVKADLTRGNNWGMNYIELVNNFWELDEVWQFNCCETRLYFYLLKVANRLGWMDSWTHSDVKTSANVGVSPNVMKNARNKLIQSGLLSVKTGGKGFGDKTRYQILTPKSQPTLQPKDDPKLAPLNKQKPKLKHKEDDLCLPFGDTDIVPEKMFVEEVVKFFNGNCKGLSPVKAITEKRKKAVMARYREHGKEAIFEMISKASKSKFLNGQSKRDFVATFDWLFKPEYFIRTLEGNYDERKKIDGNNKTGEDLNDRPGSTVGGETQPDYSERF